MDETRVLAEQFEADRPRLRAVAYRMLGSSNDADDAVQEAWIRLHRSDATEIENLGGWLTTVVARVCLDMLRSRESRREDPLAEHVETVVADPDPVDPAQEAVMADSVGLALLVVLDTLTPAERLAFVLHDMFAMRFEEIAPIVGRSVAATRQLASRARRRVRGADLDADAAADRAHHRRVVDAFLAASRSGEFDALLALLDPDVVLRADPAAVATGADAELVGAPAVAQTFSGRARAARPALVGGSPGLVWMQGGAARVGFAFTIDGDRITGIEIFADPERLLDVALD